MKILVKKQYIVDKFKILQQNVAKYLKNTIDETKNLINELNKDKEQLQIPLNNF